MAFPDLPYTGDDLRAIADAVDAVEAVVRGGDLLGSPILGRIEVHRPDGDQREVVGHIAPHDDWFGFVPLQSADGSPHA